MVISSGILRYLLRPRVFHPRPTQLHPKFLKRSQHRPVTVGLPDRLWSRNRSLRRSRPLQLSQPIILRLLVFPVRPWVFLPVLVVIATEYPREGVTRILNRRGTVRATSAMESLLVLHSGTWKETIETEAGIVGREGLRQMRITLRGTRIGLLFGRRDHVNRLDRERGRGLTVRNYTDRPSEGVWRVAVGRLQGIGRAYLLVVPGRWQRI